MPTWATHLATSKKVSEKICIDKNIFAFGNLLPDIPNRYVIKGIEHYISHARTHFETEILVVEHIEKRYDLKNFAQKYKDKFSNPLMLGYYVHLLTDYYWNDKTYGEHGIYDEEKNRIGLILNNQEKVLCSKEKARQIKAQDFKIFSEYIYKNKLAGKLEYDNKIETYLKEIDWIKLNKEEIQKTIEYVMDKYTGKSKVLQKDEDREYKIYSEKEMILSIEESVNFILKMIHKHAPYLLNKT